MVEEVEDAIPYARHVICGDLRRQLRDGQDGEGEEEAGGLVARAGEHEAAREWIEKP